MNHCCSMSPGVAENVFIAWPDEIGSFASPVRDATRVSAAIEGVF
jgi:hypothetical protein